MESFTTFCMCFGKTKLYPDFHSYYCTFKFADLLPNMDQSQIGEVCLAFYRKRISHGENHPVQIEIKSSLVRFLTTNMDFITTENMSRICLYLSLHFPESLSQQFMEFQEKICQHKIFNEMSLKDVVTIAATNPQHVSKV